MRASGTRARRWWLLALLMWTCASASYVARADGITLVVDSTADTPDANPGDTLCLTAAGQCTLRAAIQEANALPGLDRVTFAIPGDGIPTIRPSQPLPTITDPIHLDASTQPAGWVELDGTAAGPHTDGLRVSAGDSVLRGLVINRFSGNGIYLYGRGGNLVAGTRIGVDPTGGIARPNTLSGILIFESPANTVGGLTPADRNVLSGNSGAGLHISGPASVDTVVHGNYIGLTAAGDAALGNGSDGIFVSNAPRARIGGPDPAARNVIAANGINGVNLAGADARQAAVQGNYIGSDATGLHALGNTYSGVFVNGAPDATVGGVSSAAGNLLSGNKQTGVSIYGRSATGVLVQGNLIGADVSGVRALPNSADGVVLAAPLNVVGGTIAGARNIVAGNGSNGIAVFGIDATANLILGNYIGVDITGAAALPNAEAGVLLYNAASNTVGGLVPAAANVVAGNARSGVIISSLAAAGNRVQGNLIGVDPAGRPLGNGGDGVLISLASSNIIGGASPGAGNLIGGNTGRGIQIFGANANANVVQGNHIGALPSAHILHPLPPLVGGRGRGVEGVGNSEDGIFIHQAANTVIGGPEPGAANTIAHNGRDPLRHAGILITAGAGHRIRRNAIGPNTGLGIDLAPNGLRGVTPNDPTDSDTGPNNLQNHPVITRATRDPDGTTIVEGVLLGRPNITLSVELFVSATCDPSGFGEGERFLAAQEFPTDFRGDGAFRFTLTASLDTGSVLTATATDPAGNTSEFSPCFPLTDLLVPSPTATGSAATATSTSTPDLSSLPTTTPTATPTATPSSLPTATATPTLSPSTSTPSPSAPPSSTPSPTATPSPSPTSSVTAAAPTATTPPSITPSATSTATPTPTPTLTVPTPRPTATLPPVTHRLFLPFLAR